MRGPHSNPGPIPVVFDFDVSGERLGEPQNVGLDIADDLPMHSFTATQDSDVPQDPQAHAEAS